MPSHVFSPASRHTALDHHFPAAFDPTTLRPSPSTALLRTLEPTPRWRAGPGCPSRPGSRRAGAPRFPAPGPGWKLPRLRRWGRARQRGVRWRMDRRPARHTSRAAPVWKGGWRDVEGVGLAVVQERREGEAAGAGRHRASEKAERSRRGGRRLVLLHTLSSSFRSFLSHLFRSSSSFVMATAPEVTAPVALTAPPSRQSLASARSNQPHSARVLPQSLTSPLLSTPTQSTRRGRRTTSTTPKRPGPTHGPPPPLPPRRPTGPPPRSRPCGGSST